MSDPPKESDQETSLAGSRFDDPGATIQLSAEEVAALSLDYPPASNLDTDRVNVTEYQGNENALVLDLSGLSDTGHRRTHNEDSFVIQQPGDDAVLAKRGILCAVADGLGGHNAGDVASSLAVECLVNAYYNSTEPNMIAALQDAYNQTNQAIYEKNLEMLGPDTEKGMGTTLVTAALSPEGLVIANVGDSRAYQINSQNKTIRQVTADHSWVAEQVRQGLMTANEAEHHHLRNLITRAIGQTPRIEVDFFPIVPQYGDIFILCSDGLHGPVKQEDLLNEVIQKNASLAAQNLINLANNRGGPDNITVIILKIGRVR